MLCRPTHTSDGSADGFWDVLTGVYQKSGIGDDINRKEEKVRILSVTESG